MRKRFPLGAYFHFQEYAAQFQQWLHFSPAQLLGPA